MNSNDRLRTHRKVFSFNRLGMAGAAVLGSLLIGNRTMAFETYNDGGYGGCADCHGAFTDDTSTKDSVFPSDNKHTMHRGAQYMNTDCNLCHSAADGNPPDPFIGFSDGTSNNEGLGCTGCHEKFGLRAHHAANGVTECAECHENDGTPPEENVKPPYYGTPDTNVDNPSNDVLAANINENWTEGDFIGLDNDGDNLCDLADYSCGPFRIIAVVQEGSNIRVRWETAGGRTEQVQSASALTNAFSNIESSVPISGVGIVTQEVVEVDGAVEPQRFYRVRSIP